MPALEGDWLVRWRDGRWAYGLWDATWRGATCPTCGGTIMRYTGGQGRYARICVRDGTRVAPDVALVAFPAYPDRLGLLPGVWVRGADGAGPREGTGRPRATAR